MRLFKKLFKSSEETYKKRKNLYYKPNRYIDDFELNLFTGHVKVYALDISEEHSGLETDIRLFINDYGHDCYLREDEMDLYNDIHFGNKKECLEYINNKYFKQYLRDEKLNQLGI